MNIDNSDNPDDSDLNISVRIYDKNLAPPIFISSKILQKYVFVSGQI